MRRAFALRIQLGLRKSRFSGGLDLSPPWIILADSQPYALQGLALNAPHQELQTRTAFRWCQFFLIERQQSINFSKVHSQAVFTILKKKLGCSEAGSELRSRITVWAWFFPSSCAPLHLTRILLVHNFTH